MSHYKHVPFTSNLQMWSPSSSLISLDFNMTAYPYATAASTQTAAPNHYHHEPLFYPAALSILDSSSNQHNHNNHASPVFQFSADYSIRKTDKTETCQNNEENEEQTPNMHPIHLP
ncbi:hypothetical protein MUCCIDRAFT_107782 [Mucor lusitanicus CBS 277.49]|uniref:Uncharacterized protein n=1 Tax=Mucor lusitanicus CBS 277.49 TaxID=747725 RepID=A0A168P542_MUCCL|nr:hypothetical protein MUCCIDRAFT_107782 [Mucor lusitanicus CBS 277.49]